MATQNRTHSHDSHALMYSIDVSEEMFTLLRSINERLTAGYGIESHHDAKTKSSESQLSDQTTLVVREKPPYRWYTRTYRGQDWAAEIPLPESGALSPDPTVHEYPDPDLGLSDSETYKLLSGDLAFVVDDSTHGFRVFQEHSYWGSAKYWFGWGGLWYESPFLRRHHEFQHLKDRFSAHGSMWAIPEDGRIALSLSPKCLSHFKSRDAREQDRAALMQRLDDFDSDIGEPGRAFFIVDFDPYSDCRLFYEPTKTVNCYSSFKKPRSPVSWDISWEHQKSNVMYDTNLEIPKIAFRPIMSDWKLISDSPRAIPSNVAPWRRLISIEGLASTSMEDCPYVDRKAAKESDLMNFYHLTCERRPHFLNNTSIFHMTFYEIVDKRPKTSHWRIGELFGENKKFLRLSALTFNLVHDTYNEQSQFTPFFTAYCLWPERFLAIAGNMIELQFCFHCLTAIEAKFCLVKISAASITGKWSELDDYLSDLLAEDFMHLKSYVRLLFDDENFTRSQKYFWVITCLNEFEDVISTNIKYLNLSETRFEAILAWENIEALLDAASVTDPRYGDPREYPQARIKSLRRSLDEINASKERLIELQNEFRKKLETVKALRDGLFNASSLVESRASTRLGANVKLLTYVSIFYLPLAFCAALWAIPNIDSSATRTPLIVTSLLVGVITYAIVFNLHFMSNKLKKVYNPIRESLVQQMQQEEGWWKQMGGRFEEFKPTSETQVPTEWLIPFYMIRQALRYVFCRRKFTSKATAKEHEPPNISARRPERLNSTGLQMNPPYFETRVQAPRRKHKSSSSFSRVFRKHKTEEVAGEV